MVGVGTAIGRVRRAALLLAAGAMILLAQPNAPLTLTDVAERNPGAGFAPAHLHQKVSVRGVVNSLAYRFPDYSLLSFEDGEVGAVLKVAASDTRLDAYRPGDEIQVRGTIDAFAGMPVILPEAIAKTGVKPAPAPVEVSVRELMGFRYLGRLVRTEVKAVAVGDTANGAYFSVEAPDRFLVFIPRAPNQAATPTLRPGQVAHVTGVSYQYCARPPFNRYFQVLAQDPAAIVVFPVGWAPSPAAFAIAAGLAVLLCLVIWTRERRARKQRERLRRTYELGEKILAAASAKSILEQFCEALPGILHVSFVRVYVHNRGEQSLDPVPSHGDAVAPLPLAVAAGEPAPAAAWCFQYHTLLSIPDPERSPFAVSTEEAAGPRLFVPMLAQPEPAGVLELARPRRYGAFTADAQELAQHLANQAGVAMRLMEQRSVREQLFRTEKLAAVGRLISSVVNELQAPLESIEDLANRTLAKALPASAERDMAGVAREARRAADIVTRLVSYASSEGGAAQPVDIGPLLRKLIQFREGDWKASGIRVRDLTPRESLCVLGSEEQLEQVFLNLLVHAEQALAASQQKSITVRAGVLAKRLLAEIAFTGTASDNPGEVASVLAVTRTVAAAHGGEIRLIEKSHEDPRFEVELPLHSAERASGPSRPPGSRQPSTRERTALVIENDEASQRRLVALLSMRQFRVVPVDNADTGLDLAFRVRFDAAFCAVHAPGLNWVELSERMQPQVGAFVLVSDRYDAELAADFETAKSFVVAKPVSESDIERVLHALEPAAPAVKHGAA